MPTQRYQNTSNIGPPGKSPKCIIDPLKVACMFVHFAQIFYPGYRKYELKPEEGIIR